MSIYKYMPTSICDKDFGKIYLLKYIFENNTFRFTSPLNFNDPFEFRFLIKNLNPSKSDDLNNLINNIFDTNELHNNVLDFILKDIGVFCLSAKKEDLKMWGHYADNHKGILLELDSKHNFFHKSTDKIELIHGLEEVKYVKNRLSFNTDDEYFENKKEKSMYLTKNQEWKYEKEYRITILLDESNDNNKYNIEFPPQIITSVYIGANTSKNDIEYILNLKKQDKWKHLNIYRFEIDKYEYKLVLFKLR